MVDAISTRTINLVPFDSGSVFDIFFEVFDEVDAVNLTLFVYSVVAAEFSGEMVFAKLFELVYLLAKLLVVNVFSVPLRDFVKF